MSQAPEIKSSLGTPVLSHWSEDEPAQPTVQTPQWATMRPALGLIDDGPALSLKLAKSVQAGSTQKIALKAQAQARPTEVHWIGGAGDKKRYFWWGPHHLMRGLKNRFELQTSGADYYWGYYESKKLLEHLVKRARQCGCTPKLTLVGHSWGAAAALRITQELKPHRIKVDTLVTLDPVSRKKLRNSNNYRRWVNVYRTDRTRKGKGNQVAKLGGSHGPLPGAFNVPANTDHSDAMDMIDAALGKATKLLK